MRPHHRTWRPALTVAATLLASAMGLGPAASAQANETVTGVVVSRDQVRLEGARVTLEGIGSVRTDAAGRFAFRDVSPGYYRLTVSKEGFPDEVRLISVQAAGVNKVRIVLAGAVSSPSPPSAIAVPIVQEGSTILVQGRLNHQVETFFLVDTGATLCVLTKATADRLGLTSSSGETVVTVNTASGSIEAPLIQVDLIQVGEAEARSVGAIIHDLPSLPSTVGAVLGLSFLNRFKVEIDAVERVMLLSR